MNSGLYAVFRCQMCGAVFEEKVDRPEDYIGNTISQEQYAEHVGARESYVVSTHHCALDDGINPDTYGCGRLIGCRIYKGAAHEAPAPPTPRTVAEVAKAATDAGMSYGKYVQMMQRTVPTEKTPEPADSPVEPPVKEKHKHTRYTVEAKKQAVQMVNSGECSISEASERLGIPYYTLYGWVRACIEHTPPKRK